MVEPQAECANNRTKVGYSSKLWRILDLWPNVAAAVKVNTLLEVAWRERGFSPGVSPPSGRCRHGDNITTIRAGLEFALTFPAF
jgi:hypothetical protein